MLDFGGTLKRAWDIVWEHKFLILLGMIVALGSSSGGGSGRDFDIPSAADGLDFDMPRWALPDLRGKFGLTAAAIIAAGLVILSLAVVVGVTIWIVSTIARGGLIAGVNAIDAGGTSTFSEAWRAGWQKGWRLLGIGILPAIPAFLLLLLGLGAAILAGVYGLFGEGASYVSGAGLGVVFALVACVLIPISLVLTLLRTFANRACMLDDLGVVASYREGLEVLVANIGPTLILFLIQIVVGAALSVALFLPGLVRLICRILWPLLLAIRGTVTSYLSTMWTLDWREWTDLSQVSELAPGTAETGNA